MVMALAPMALKYDPGALDEVVQDADPGFDTHILFFPGMYAPSGFDVMRILYHVATRPNPTIDLGPVDCSCPIVLCDLYLPDTPIVYASASYLSLTGYSLDEVLGRNCRFLQWPPCQVQQPPWEQPQQGCPPSGPSPYVPSRVRQVLRQSIQQGCDVQVEVINFRKDGTPFLNFLSVVPIYWDDMGAGLAGGSESPPYAQHRYSVGFLCDKSSMGD